MTQLTSDIRVDINVELNIQLIIHLSMKVFVTGESGYEVQISLHFSVLYLIGMQIKMEKNTQKNCS